MRIFKRIRSQYNIRWHFSAWKPESQILVSWQSWSSNWHCLRQVSRPISPNSPFQSALLVRSVAIACFSCTPSICCWWLLALSHLPGHLRENERRLQKGVPAEQGDQSNNVLEIRNRLKNKVTRSLAFSAPRWFTLPPSFWPHLQHWRWETYPTRALNMVFTCLCVTWRLAWPFPRLHDFREAISSKVSRSLLRLQSCRSGYE